MRLPAMYKQWAPPIAALRFPAIELLRTLAVWSPVLGAEASDRQSNGTDDAA